MEKTKILLTFINKLFETNVFVGINLEQIEKLEDFSVDKNILINIDNAKLCDVFTDDMVNLLSNNFESFSDIYVKTKSSANCVIAILVKLIAELSDNEVEWKFSIGNPSIITCTKQIKLSKLKQNICTCLRSPEIRHQVRAVDPDAVCICGLFEYRDKSPQTHSSYGEFKGCFSFPDPLILYNFILNSEFKSKYLFVENRTNSTIAYFDLDFKLEKHNLSEYLNVNDKDNMNNFINHIIQNICMEIDNYEYIYSDKNVGNGIHLYFPTKILTKTELLIHTKKICSNLIKQNFLNLPKTNNVHQRVYKFILDQNVCHTGICFMFQNKNGSHYKINLDKSTYPNIPEDRIKQLILCQLRIE